MILVYVAGKFSGKTRAAVERNIAAAVDVGVRIAEIGAMPLIPHANSSHPRFERVQPYQFWIDGTLELLKRCDAICMVNGWAESSGATGEKRWAQTHGMPVFYEHLLEDLKSAIENSKSGIGRIGWRRR